MESFEVWMDHENLKYFWEPHKLNGWQAWWYLKLQDYDFILQHILGKMNTKADILSRKDQINMKEDNKDIQMLKEELWTRRTMAEVIMLKRMTTTNKQEILEEIRRNGTKEWEVIQALEKDNRLLWEEDKIVYMERRMYIPNNKKLKEKILQENHNSVDVEHLRQQRMLELIKQNYWWPGLKEDIKKYIQGCLKCQQNKVQH